MRRHLLFAVVCAVAGCLLGIPASARAAVPRLAPFALASVATPSAVGSIAGQVADGWTLPSPPITGANGAYSRPGLVVGPHRLGRGRRGTGGAPMPRLWWSTTRIRRRTSRWHRGRLRSTESEQPLLNQAGSLDQSEVMRFYRERGPLYCLGHEQVVADATGRPTRPAVRRFEETCGTVGGDPFWWIRQQTKEIWTVLELWQAWSEQDIVRLRELLGPMQSRLPVRPRPTGRRSEQQKWEPDEWWRVSPGEQQQRLAERRKRGWPEPECTVADVIWTGERLQTWMAVKGRPDQTVEGCEGIPGWPLTPEVPLQYLAPMSKHDCLRHAWHFIRTRVEHHLQHVTPGLALTDDEEVAAKMVLRFETLLEAIYIHVRRVIGGAERIGRCRECGRLYVRLREDKSFCSIQHANTYWRREKRG